MKKTTEFRSILTMVWSIAAIGMMYYILFKYGDRIEILTLMIGMIGTIIGGIFGLWFAGSHKGNSVTPTGPTTNQIAGDANIINEPPNIEPIKS